MKRISIYAKIILPLFLLSLFCFPVRALTEPSAPQISAESAIVYDANTKTVIYEKNADERRGMASTTKIAAAIVVIETNRLDETVKVTKEMTGIEGSSLYLKEGEMLTVKELLYGLMLRSANDASVALAIYLYGSVEEFVCEMNRLCDKLSLCNTHFENPHGLDGESHYTTARELALLAAYAEESDIFREIVSTKKICIGKGENRRLLVNHNKLLTLYEGVGGIKTGFTKKCGRTLVSSLYHGTAHLICVTLNAPDDWRDHKELLDHGLSVLNVPKE